MSKYDEFLANPEMVKSWKHELVKNQTLRMVLEAMESESPARKDVPADAKLSPHGMIDHGGFVRGFEDYSKKFYALATLQSLPEPIEADYGVPDQPETD